MFKVIVLLALSLFATSAMAVDRSTTERYAFDRMVPCPVPTKSKHVCPGYIRAHAVPLSCARSKAERKWLDSRYNFVWVATNVDPVAGSQWTPAQCLYKRK